jgi:hypothetical protein
VRRWRQLGGVSGRAVAAHSATAGAACWWRGGGDRAVATLSATMAAACRWRGGGGKSYSHMNSYVRFHPKMIEIILTYEFICPFSP